MTYTDLLQRSWGRVNENLVFIMGLTLATVLGSAVLAMIPFVGSFFSSIFALGYTFCLIQMNQKKPIGYQDFFWPWMDFNRFLKILILNFFTGLGTLIAFLLLIIPGFWWIVATMFSSACFVLGSQENGGDPVAAIKNSMSIVKGRWWFFAGLALIIGILNVIGALCFLIGILVTIPVSAFMVIEVVQMNMSPSKSDLIEGSGVVEPRPLV